MKKIVPTIFMAFVIFNISLGQNSTNESSIRRKFEDVEKIMSNNPEIAHKLLDTIESELFRSDFLETKIKIKYYLFRANTYKLGNDFVQALEIINQLDKLELDQDEQINFNATKSSILAYLGKYNEAETLANYTLKIINQQKLSDFKSLGLLYFTKGYIDVKTYKSTAIDNLLKAENYLSTSNANEGLGSVYNFLAILYKNVSNFQKSLEYCLKAEKVLPKHHINYGAIMNVKAQNYQFLGMDKDAEITFQAIMNNEYFGDRIKLFGGNSYGIFLKEKERYQEATEILTKILPISRKLNLKRKEAEILANLGSIQFDTKNYKEALKYYSEAKVYYFDESNQVDFENKISLQEMYVKSKLINIDGFYDLDYYIILRDSFDKLNLKENTNENLAKYETEKKERLLQTERNRVLAQKNEILELNIRNTNLNKSELQNQFELLRIKSNADSLNNVVEISHEKNLNLEKLQALQNESLVLKNRYLTFGGVALLGISLLALQMLFLYRSRLKLSQSLKVKNSKIILLHQELNHRVKNNLSFMTSLVEMQGRRTQNIEARRILQETENRLAALSLVHSNLFHNDETSTVNLANYLTELVIQLEKIFTIPDKDLSIMTDFIDYHVNADDAMRLGLIVNELITNSVKHAFIDVNNPQINIATSKDKTGKLKLEYKDNGPGHSHVSNLSNEESNVHLGTKLIALLREQMKDRYTVIC